MRATATHTLGAHGAERLATLIREQAAAEAQQFMSAARQRAEQVRRDADAEVDVIRTAAEREGERRGRRRAARQLALAEARARLEWLRARQALIDTVIERAQGQLAEFASMPEAARRLADLIREALPALPDGPLRVRVPASYELLADEALREKHGSQRLLLQMEGDAVSAGGVVVETEDGRLRFDNSFPARISRARDELHWMVATFLGLRWERAGFDGE